MINLPNIELIAISSVRIEDHIKALLYSSNKIKFGAIKLFSHYKPNNLPENIEYIKTPELSHSGYSWFNIEELYKYTTHDYTICINDDGFIINPELWDDNFLNYDLIGAPWSPDAEWLYDLGRPGNRVGNGGFYLRSRKFINLASNIRYTGGHDDAILSNDYYDYFIQNGCKYAPVEVAMKFSLEYVIPECEHNLDKTFGFHGKHDLTHEKLKLLKNIEYTIA